MNTNLQQTWTIQDLTPAYHDTYCCCLEDWSNDIKDAGNHKACWYEKYKHKGLAVKIALNERNEAVGMIQTLPLEESFVQGHDLIFVLCIWVHGHKQGLGNYQGIGIGEQLLAAAENDAREKGAHGMAAWGLWMPFWMKASWYKKYGYRKADRDGLTLLVWKPFTDYAEPPVWIRPKQKPPIATGKVTVAAFINGWCPAQNIIFERAKRACAQFGDAVEFLEYDTSDRDTFMQWGISDGVFLNGRPVSYGPPPPYEKILKLIKKEVNKLHH